MDKRTGLVVKLMDLELGFACCSLSSIFFCPRPNKNRMCVVSSVEDVVLKGLKLLGMLQQDVMQQ